MFSSSNSPRKNEIGDPEFLHKDFKNACCNAAKTSRASGNDANCNLNVKGLIAECERLSLIAKKNQMSQKEMDKFVMEKKKFMEQDVHQLVSIQAELRDKNTEIAYLETQLKQHQQTIMKLK
jgi:septal ring factor EnvC (AmiA/AmiB activator)